MVKNHLSFLYLFFFLKYLTRQNSKISNNKITSHILQKENLQKENIKNSLLQPTYSHNSLSTVTITRFYYCYYIYIYIYIYSKVISSCNLVQYSNPYKAINLEVRTQLIGHVWELENGHSYPQPRETKSSSTTLGIRYHYCKLQLTRNTKSEQKVYDPSLSLSLPVN